MISRDLNSLIAVHHYGKLSFSRKHFRNKDVFRFWGSVKGDKYKNKPFLERL